MKKSLTLLLLLTACCSLSAQNYTNPLTLLFNNESTMNSNDVYVSISSGANVDFVNPGSVGTNINWTGGNTYSDPVSLAQLYQGGGLSFTNGSSTIFYVTYGAPLGSLTTAPSPVATNDASYNIPWQAFEITKDGTAGAVGDLTYINEFSAPMSITSYSSNNALLQTSGFGNNSVAQIFNSLASITGYNTNAVLTSTNGTYTRVVAPVSFGDLVGPYDNFHSYITALASNNTTTDLSNVSGFPVGTNVGRQTTNFTFNLTNSYTAAGYMIASGNVIAANATNPALTNIYSGLTIVYSNSNVTNIGAAIYGANYTTASNTISFVDTTNYSTSTNWANMLASLTNGYGNDTTNGSVTGSNAYATILSQMIGEVSASIESGLAGSTNLVTNMSVSGILGTNLSSAWWTMTNPLPIMSGAQTNSLYYDAYGNVIFTNSANSVYNFSYNDRYNNAKPVVFSDVYNGTNVATWVIGIGVPVSLVPEPSTTALIGLATLAILVSIVRKRHQS
jgi:hypothetical protein